MLIAVVALQFAILLAVLALIFRKPAAAAGSGLAELADRFDRLDLSLREAVAQMRTSALDEATRTRSENAIAAGALRTEVLGSITTLGGTLGEGLNNFRQDNKTSSDQLRRAVETQMDTLAQRLSAFTSETAAHHTALRESLNTKLTDLTTSNTALQEKLRTPPWKRVSASSTRTTPPSSRRCAPRWMKSCTPLPCKRASLRASARLPTNSRRCTQASAK